MTRPKLAHSDRPVIVLAGDGGMQMLGNAELVTISRMWPHWANPCFVVCVLNNGDLAEVSWEQREMGLEVMTDPAVPLLPPFPHGEAKLGTMRAGLEQEGATGNHARALLDEYARLEQDIRRGDAV